MSPQAKRAFKAFVALATVIAFVPLSGAVEKQVGWGSEVAKMASQAINDGVSGKEIADEEENAGPDVEGLASMVGARVGKDSVPKEFEQECLSLDDADNSMASEDGMLVGFTMECDADRAFSQMTDELLSKGWAIAASGKSTCATFLKSDGEYGWLLVTCVNVSDRASVVVQCTKRRN